MKIAIISAMWCEAEIIHAKMSDPVEHIFASNSYFSGKISGVDAVLTVCSIGKVNAAIYTQILIDRFSPDAIIHTGIAGGLSPDLRHLDTVVAEKLTYHDVRPRQMASFHPKTDHFFADTTIVSELRKIIPDCKIGTIVTGDDFIDSFDKKANITARYDALCVEMEGAAVAHTAFVNGVRFAVLRTISDLADGSAVTDYDEFEKIAAKKAAGIVLELVEKLGGGEQN